MKNLSYYLMIFCLLFAPLAFGTVEHWSLATLEVVIGISCVMLFFGVWRSGNKLVHAVGLLPLLLLLIYISFQLIPLPAWFVSFLSPNTYDIYQPVIAASGQERWIPLSVQPKETLHELLRLISYVFVYITTIQLLKSPERLKKTANLVIFLAASICFLAIIQSVGSPDKIYWFRTVPPEANFFGPWVNVNQFAGYIEMLCPLSFALFLFYKPRIRGDESLKEKIVSFFTEPSVHMHLFLGFSTLLMVLAVFLSLCRGGILSLVVSGFAFLFLYNLKFPKSSRVVALVVMLCCVVMVSFFGWEKILMTFNESFDDSGRLTDGRLTLWADTWEIIKDYPIFGAGFGSFMALYPLYKTINDDLIYDHAHNDYLELLTDGGSIASILCLWFVLAILLHGWKMIRVRRDQYSILIGIGTISGVIAILAHSVTDFNLHNGAVGFYFFFLLGMLVAGVNCKFSYYSSGTLLESRPASQTLGFAGIGLLLLVVIVVVQAGTFWAASHYKSIKNIYLNAHLHPRKLQNVEEMMTQASRIDPFEGYYSYKLGTVKSYQNEGDEAYRHMVIAGFKNPLEGIFLQQIGLLSDKEEGSRQLIEEGYRRALQKDKLVFSYADHLFWKGRRVEALELLQQRLERNFREIIQWLPLLYGNDVTYEEIVGALPSSTEAWLFYARYCEANTTFEEADLFYAGAIELLPDSRDNAPIHPKWLHQAIKYFDRRDQEELKVYAIRKGVELLPEDPSFRIGLGDYYLENGITYRAKEEYEKALVFDPNNKMAKSRLRKMGFEDSY